MSGMRPHNTNGVTELARAADTRRAGLSHQCGGYPRSPQTRSIKA